MPDDKRRPDAAEPEADPFDAPIKQCPDCGRALEITRPDFAKVDGLRVGLCEPCGRIAALVERINPIWRRGDDPNILDILARDMEDSERQARAYFGDEYDPAWTRIG